jgi:hypothetical protein
LAGLVNFFTNKNENHKMVIRILIIKKWIVNILTYFWERKIIGDITQVSGGDMK